MSLSAYKEDMSLLIDKARRAGALAQHLKAAGLSITYKSDGSIVTNGDLEVNIWLKEALLNARPDYGWQSEESADTLDRLSAKRVFVLDPIDGTMGFSKGSPFWTIAIAIVEDGIPVAAVVYAPDANELYSACLGEGAYLNDTPIKTNTHAELGQGEVLGDARMYGRDIWLKPWPRLRVTSRPSIAYRMVLIAGGGYDFTLSLAPKRDWDLAAACLIVTESGGKVTDHLGNSYTFNGKDSLKISMICSNGALHGQILDYCAHLDDLQHHNPHERRPHAG